MTTPEQIAPSTSLKAFVCPHCFAFTTQTWRKVLVSYSDKDNIPFRVTDAEQYKIDFREMFNKVGRHDEELPDWIDRIAAGLPHIADKYDKTVFDVENVDASQCYHCDKIAIWVGQSIVWPRRSDAPKPNAALPSDIISDFREAGEIVDASPRGAAAILRLCIQKLCRHLGEPGKNINEDIGSLVKKGLDPRVQQMMDTLRIFGNNAVHPGEIDLRDDRDSAEKLFFLVNLIAEIMIAQPKAINEMYGRIGSSQIQAIVKRDLG